MKTFLKTAFLSAISLILLSANAPLALASMPYLMATTSGGGNVQLTINSADPYSRIDLSYRPQGTSLWTQISNVGYTDQGGYFNQSVNIGYQGTQMDMYVTINGQQSPTVSVNGSGGGCNTYPYNCGSNLSLSQSNVNINAGQSSTVSVYGNYNNSIYISNNTNSSVATATVSGNSINVYGNSNGSTTMTICSYSNSATCAMLYVTVSGNGCTQYNCNNQLTFSQSNVSLNNGQSTYISIYSSGSNTFYVTNNSNPNAVSATISGSTLNLYAQGSGSSTVQVCTADYISRCGYVYVSVGNNCNYYNCNGQITFSQNNLSMSYGQTNSVSIYGGNYGSYYVSNNSNSSVVSATVSGSTLNLYAYNSGSTTLTVCSSGNSNQCGYLYVTVSGGCTYYNCNGQIYFTPLNPSVNIGQTTNVSINNYQNSGYNSYYVSSNSNSSIVSATVSGNLVSLYGRASGTASISICNTYGSSQCGTLYVTVNGSVLGGNIYVNGTLVNDNGTIYITYKNMKSGFASYAAFTGLGYSLSNVIYGSTASMTNNGYVVSTANAAHPWGSWVKNGSTIYFVHEQGLIPIASYDVFTNNGGKLSGVVNANWYDMQKPILFIMTYNDSRLQ